MDGRKLRKFGEDIGIPIGGGSLDDDRTDGDEYIRTISFAKNAGTDIWTAYRTLGEPGIPATFKYFVESYENYKREYGFLDFDDMLELFEKSLSKDPHTPVACVDKLLIDEAQDLTPMQWSIVEMLSEQAVETVIAGDDDQSVYTWMGADPSIFINMKRFPHEVLEQSHRVPKKVYDQAMAVISQIENRVEKNYRPRQGTGKLHFSPNVSEEDFRACDDNMMVLFRDRYRMRDFEKILREEMIPYSVIGGSSPFTNKWASKIKKGEEFDLLEVPTYLYDFYINLALRPHLFNAPMMRLGTMHQSKGLEANQVWVDLTLQGKALKQFDFDPDSERRLLYVAMTRARETLTLCGESPIVS
jgi:superfamily I DNA/RNA helicase